MKKLTIEQLNKRIESTNSEYKKATKAQKRVMIAQDILDRMDLAQLRADEGTFVNIKGTMEDDCSIKQELEKGNIKECKVCAKGAILMGIIGRENKVSYGFLLEIDVENKTDVEKVFSKRQLDIMEAAFEGDDVCTMQWNELDEESPTYDKAMSFYEKNHNSEDRLRGIATNIIENKGTFKP